MQKLIKYKMFLKKHKKRIIKKDIIIEMQDN